MDEKLHYKIHVTGHVQGVGFRWSALRAARNLGINGLVKNLPDGTVYLEAEGTREQLETYREWCKNGPGFVESVSIEISPPVNYIDFRIEH